MARTTINKLEDLAADLGSLIGDAESEIASANDRVEELEGELDAANNELEAANQRIKELEDELACSEGRSLTATETSLYGT